MVAKAQSSSSSHAQHVTTDPTSALHGAAGATLALCEVINEPSYRRSLQGSMSGSSTTMYA